MDMFKVVEFYLNIAVNLHPLTPHIMPVGRRYRWTSSSGAAAANASSVALTADVGS